MNCSTFRKKLNAYMEDDVQYDMKKAMEKHLDECVECRHIYEEEDRIDNIFRSSFEMDNIKFNSSRATIMKSIDKNKYSDSLASRIRLHIKKYQKNYLSCAAILTIILISTPLISRLSQNGMLSFGNAKSENIAMDSAAGSKSEISGTNGSENNSITTKETQLKGAEKSTGEGTTKMSTADSKNQIYIPIFKRVQSERDPEKGMATSPKLSPNGKLQAQLDGRGISAGDEGVADIFILDEKKEKWRLQLVDNDINFTPMYLEWMDNENVLVTMGLSTGHATYGGSVYVVNVSSGKVFLVYEVDSNKEQVANIKKLDNAIKLTVKVFTDDIKNATRDEERILNFTMITDKNSIPINTLYEYAAAINNKMTNEALDKLTSDSKKDYVNQVGDIQNINSINIIKIIDVTSDTLIDQSLANYAAVKLYYTQAEYNINNPTIKAQGNEILYQKVIMVKEKNNSSWLIKSIQVINQSSTN